MRRSILGLLCSTVFATSALADDTSKPEEAGNATIPILPQDFIPNSLTLQASGGKYEKWQKDLPCHAGHLRTNVTITQPDKNPRWETAAGLILRAGVAAAASLHVHTVFHTGPLAIDMISATYAPAPGKVTARHNFSSHPYFGDTIAIDVAWSSTGQVAVKISERDVKLVMLDGSISSLELFSSGGKAVFQTTVVECLPTQ